MSQVLTYSRPIEWYQFQANRMWWDGPLETVSISWEYCRQGVHFYADRPDVMERIEGAWVDGLLGRSIINHLNCIHNLPTIQDSSILYIYICATHIETTDWCDWCTRLISLLLHGSGELIRETVPMTSPPDFFFGGGGCSKSRLGPGSSFFSFRNKEERPPKIPPVARSSNWDELFEDFWARRCCVGGRPTMERIEGS